MGRKRQHALLIESGQGRAKPHWLCVPLAAFFSTMLIYAGTVTPFLLHASVASFMALYAPASLCALAIAALAISARSLAGKGLSRQTLRIGGCAAYLIGSASFCFLALYAACPAWLLVASAFASGAGGCFLGLSWGRIFSRFSLGSALVNIGIACMIASLAYAAYAHLSLAAATVLFMALSIVAAIAPFAFDAPPQGDDRPASQSGVRGLMRSFSEVAIEPAIGLLVFAFVMGLTCNTFVGVIDIYLSASLASAAALIILAYAKTRRPLAHLLYRDCIPAIAIIALAVPSIVATAGLPASLTTATTLLLYTFAAFVTLATLCAIAHASEFSPDFVFSFALLLFAIASIAGLACASVLSAEVVEVLTTLCTVAYATAAVLIRNFRASGYTEEEPPACAPASQTPQQRCAALSASHGLTSREQEILAFLAEGHNATFISEALFISPSTVRTHVRNIYRKLGVASREDILRLTREQ